MYQIDSSMPMQWLESKIPVLVFDEAWMTFSCLSKCCLKPLKKVFTLTKGRILLFFCCTASILQHIG